MVRITGQQHGKITENCFGQRNKKRKSGLWSIQGKYARLFDFHEKKRTYLSIYPLFICFYSAKNPGSQVVSAGIYVINIRMIKDIRSIGATAFNAAESFEPANWFPISIQIPTGGVIRPIHRLKDITIPNWMVSTPNAFIKGSSCLLYTSPSPRD